MIENGVHIGIDDWLFLMSGSNAIDKLFFEENFFSSEEARVWNDLLLRRKDKIESAGSKYVHLWVPDKLSVYDDFLSPDIGVKPNGPLTLLGKPEHRRGIETILVEIKDALREASKASPVYWKTDTHWTPFGAYVAYSEICKHLGIQPNTGLASRPTDEMVLALDLGSKLNPVRKEKWCAARILVNARIEHRNEMVKFIELLAPALRGEMHTGTSVRFRNSSPDRDPRTVLVFGDSYCEYRPHSLTALLAETFDSVQFVWSTSIDYGLIRDKRPDIVITEMAERFVKRLPKDDFSLNDHVYNRIADFLNRRCAGELREFSWKDKAAP